MALSINDQPLEAMVEKLVAERAHCYWVERGRPIGSPEVDWYRAVDDVCQELSLRGNAVHRAEK